MAHNPTDTVEKQTNDVRPSPERGKTYTYRQVLWLGRGFINRYKQDGQTVLVTNTNHVFKSRGVDKFNLVGSI